MEIVKQLGRITARPTLLRLPSPGPAPKHVPSVSRTAAYFFFLISYREGGLRLIEILSFKMEIKRFFLTKLRRPYSTIKKNTMPLINSLTALIKLFNPHNIQNCKRRNMFQQNVGTNGVSENFAP